eukprot:4107704-Amphidinium_carterae.1
MANSCTRIVKVVMCSRAPLSSVHRRGLTLSRRHVLATPRTAASARSLASISTEDEQHDSLRHTAVRDHLWQWRGCSKAGVHEMQRL